MTFNFLKKALRPTLLGRSILPVIPAALALVAAGSWQPAQALLTYNIFETSGGDVVVEASGSLTLGTPIDNSGCVYDGVIYSSLGVICTGTAQQGLLLFELTGPISFNGTVVALPASSVGGIATVLRGADSNFSIDPNYVSGAPIVSSATFSNTTLAGLGFSTTGLIGTWTLTDGGDQIQVVIDATEVPGPLPLLGAGAAFGYSRRLRRRIRASQVTTPQA
jgi:hypothetical protein